MKNNNIMETIYAEPKIRTYSGILIDVFNTNPDHILIEDIAHGLAMQCRFGGHTKKFYSVAEHSIAVSRRCPLHQLDALLHDASEAYLTDMPKPIKERLLEFQRVEDKLMEMIANKFGIQFPFAKEIKEADNFMLKYEQDNYVHGDLEPMTPEQAKEAFMNEYLKLLHEKED